MLNFFNLLFFCTLVSNFLMFSFLLFSKRSSFFKCLFFMELILFFKTDPSKLCFFKHWQSWTTNFDYIFSKIIFLMRYWRCLVARFCYFPKPTLSFFICFLLNSCSRYWQLKDLILFWKLVGPDKTYLYFYHCLTPTLF